MGKTAIFIALIIVFDGVAVAWAAWEFWTVRPQNPEADDPPKSASPEAAWHPEGEHKPDDR